MPGKFFTALRIFFILLLILLGSLLTYTFLHEAGHALTALSLGGAVTDFNVNFFDMSAHVSLQGNFTAAQNAQINLSGTAFPFILWMIALLAIPKQTAPLIQISKGIASLVVVNTLLAWIAIPFLFLFRCAPPGDDVTQFLGNSHASPLTVASIAAGLYGLGWFITVKQIEQPHTALRVLLNMEVPRFSSQSVALFIAISALVIVGSGVSISTCLVESRVPNGFALAKDLDLSLQNFDREPLISFTLTQPERVGFLLRVQNLNTNKLDVTLKKINGESLTVLHGEDFSATDNITEVDLVLDAGDYQVLITSEQSIGILKLYLKQP